MKTFATIKKITIALMLVFSSISVFGNGKLAINNYLNTEFAIISATLEPTESYQLTLKDGEGVVIYRSNIEDGSEKFQKLFDLSQLEDGIYDVVFESKESKLKSEFVLSDQHLISYKPSKGIDLASLKDTKSYIKQNEDIIYVSHINPGLLATYIEIYDEKGDSVYSATLPKQQKYAGGYNIDALPQGQYTVMLTVGPKVEKYEFQK